MATRGNGTEPGATPESLRMKSICVWMGGNSGNNPIHIRNAEQLGHLMATEHIGLVFGGVRAGLMEVVADAVLDAGGFAAGVIPRHLKYQDVAHEHLSEMHIVDTMHERKHKMQSLAHAFLALPGGFGTIDEIFEALTWAQIELHEKPCVFLNSDGYYDHLFKFLDHARAQGLLKDAHRALALQAPTPRAVIELIQGIWTKEEAALQQTLRAYEQ